MRRFLFRALLSFTISSVSAAVGLAAPAGAGEPPAPCLLPPVTARVADAFRAPGCRWCAGNRGIEYDVRPGVAVRAAAGGTVTFAGSVAGTRYVVVQHPSGLRTTYGRLASVAVVTGTEVVAGAEVGRTGVGLFFGVRSGDTYLDPASYLLSPRFPPRLVPLHGPRRAGRPGRLSCVARRTSR